MTATTDIHDRTDLVRCVETRRHACHCEVLFPLPKAGQRGEAAS